MDNNVGKNVLITPFAYSESKTVWEAIPIRPLAFETALSCQFLDKGAASTDFNN